MAPRVLHEKGGGPVDAGLIPHFPHLSSSALSRGSISTGVVDPRLKAEGDSGRRVRPGEVTGGKWGRTKKTLPMFAFCSFACYAAQNRLLPARPGRPGVLSGAREQERFVPTATVLDPARPYRPPRHGVCREGDRVPPFRVHGVVFHVLVLAAGKGAAAQEEVHQPKCENIGKVAAGNVCRGVSGFPPGDFSRLAWPSATVREKLVEPIGIEPTTSALRTLRSPN